jgi:hypothetical protein
LAFERLDIRHRCEQEFTRAEAAGSPARLQRFQLAFEIGARQADE